MSLCTYILFPVQNVQVSQEDQRTPLDVHRPSFVTLKSFEVICSFKSLQMMPVAFDDKMHFVPQLSTDARGHQQIEICDLQNGTILEKAQPSVFINSTMNTSFCPNLLNYSGKITIFGTNSKKVGLFNLDSINKSWLLIDSSDFPFQHINFSNCACCDHSLDNVVVVTVLQAFIYFYLFSPVKQNDTYWKSARVALPPQMSNCQIQSCVFISKNLYFSLLTSTHLIIYQVDSSKLYHTTNDTCLLEPAKSWTLESSSLKKCFLSSLNEEVVTIMVKKTNKILVEFSELNYFNSGSSDPIISFSDVVEVTYAMVIPNTTNLGIVYSESDVYKMCLLDGEHVIHIRTYLPYFTNLIFICM